MALEIIGEHPLALDAQGRLVSRIGTIFPAHRVLVTIPGVHATQKVEYLKRINVRRGAANQPPFNEEEELQLFQSAVDLIMEENRVFIRPNPDEMDLAFCADELLQELVSKRQIKFLHTLDPAVRQAIKQRGESWRINPLPRTPEEMQRMIQASRVSITGRAIYYYSLVTGTRWLTCQEFAALGALPPDELQQHLQEIRKFAGRRNSMGYPEVDFFAAGPGFNASALTALDFEKAGTEGVHGIHRQLAEQFTATVPADLQADAIEYLDWRTRMFSALIGLRDEVITEEALLGLGAEFFMQIEWLPGARFEEGEVLFDPIFDEADAKPDDPELAHMCDEKVKGFIFNFIREYGLVEYVNIGRVAASLSRRLPGQGRREVFIAEVKVEGKVQPAMHMIHMLKWGIREHIDEHKDLFWAIMEAEEYADYTFDRRFGCLQLGMNLPRHVTLHKVSEHYRGRNEIYRDNLIWSSYLEREFVRGIATDKIPPSRFKDREYAGRFASLIGAAAATNLITGRVDLQRRVLFDDGDEVIVEDAGGLPLELTVSEHTGTFNDYLTPLADYAPAYAQPINRRLQLISDREDFTRRYLDAFVQRFTLTQAKYRARKRAFDTLFKHRPRSEQGSFAYRWEKVLERLHTSDPLALAAGIRECVAPGA